MILTRHRRLDLTEILGSNLTDDMPKEIISVEARTRDTDHKDGTPTYHTDSGPDPVPTNIHPFVLTLGTKGGL